jgi:hypothetical protein
MQVFFAYMSRAQSGRGLRMLRTGDHVRWAAGVACPLCDRLRPVGKHSLAVPDRSDRVDRACEAIVDSFGFRAPHGGMVALKGETTPATRRAVRVAAGRIADILTDAQRYAERRHELLFAIERACPGCRVREHQVTHELRAVTGSALWHGDSSGPCYPHYHDIAFVLPPADLPGLVHRQLEAVRVAASAATELLRQGGSPPSNDADRIAGLLEATLGLVAGDPVDIAGVPSASVARRGTPNASPEWAREEHRPTR